MKRANEDDRDVSKRQKAEDPKIILESIAHRLQDIGDNTNIDESIVIYQEMSSVNCEFCEIEVAQIEYWMGRNFMDAMMLKDAKQKFESSIALLHTANSIKGLGEAHEWLGNTEYHLGNYELEVTHKLKAINIYRQTGFFEINELVLTFNVGWSYYKRLGKRVEANKYFMECVHIAERLTLTGSVPIDQKDRLMRYLNRALKLSDLERQQKIEDITKNLSTYFMVHIDEMFVNWSILTQVHRLQVDKDFPGIKTTLSQYSAFQHFALQKINKIFEETTITEIHSFLYSM